MGQSPVPETLQNLKYTLLALINFEQEQVYDLMHEAKAEIKIICKFQHPLAQINFNNFQIKSLNFYPFSKKLLPTESCYIK
jgi:capsule polysaccharide export protein KpsE/RkpR